MKYKLVYIFIMFLLILPISAQEHLIETLTHNDMNRRFRVYLPPESDEPSGLIIMLHGAGQTGSTFRGTFPIADGEAEFNYITVYPEGIAKRWSILPGSRSEVDDLDFIRVLIETMREQYNIDDKRIFITGYSNGGMMALGAGCKLSDILAGVVVISANYTQSMLGICGDVSEAYPQMLLLSTTDSSFPWNGDNNLLSAQQAIAFEFFRFKCNPENPDIAMISTEDSPISVFKLRSTECDGRGEITFYRVDDVPHYPLPLKMEIILDNGETGNMSDLYWQFIVNHTKNAEEPSDS